MANVRIEGGLAIASFKRAFIGFIDPESRGGVTVTDNILRIPGVSDISVDSPEAPTTAIDAVEGSTTEVGTAQIGNVTFTNSSLMLHTAIFKTLQRAKVAGTVVKFIVQTKEQVVKAMTDMAEESVAISGTGATQGQVTLGGSEGKDSDFFDQDDLAIGQCIVTGTGAGTKYWEIIEAREDDASGNLLAKSILVVDATTGKFPVADLAASAFRVVIPGARFTGNAKITQIGAWSAGIAAGNPMSGSIVITPSSRWAESGQIDGSPQTVAA